MTKKLSTIYILRALADRRVHAFSTREFQRLLGLDRDRAHSALHRLERGGHVKRLERGEYVVVGLGDDEVLGQPFYLATRLVEPSYISFWSALHYYGWTEQAPRIVFVANTRRTGRTMLERYPVRLVKLGRRRFFGYRLERQGPFAFPMAEPEKAVVDSLFLPGHAGGVGEVAKALDEALPDVRREILEAYARASGSKSLVSRLGYLLARRGIESEALRSAASRAYVPLDPLGPRRGRYDAVWRIIDNREEA